MKYFKISSVLCLIALVCATLIASFNMLTAPIIEANKVQKELDAITAIYSDYNAEKSETIYDALENSSADIDSRIEKKILAKNESGEELGYLYTMAGKNSYGAIKLIVAIKDGKVYQVEMLENGQSFASTVQAHLKDKYPSSKDNKVVIDPYGNQKDPAKVDSLDKDALANIDTKCGATFGAKTVNELVTVALNDALKEVK